MYYLSYAREGTSLLFFHRLFNRTLFFPAYEYQCNSLDAEKITNFEWAIIRHSQINLQYLNEWILLNCIALINTCESEVSTMILWSTNFTTTKTVCLGHALFRYYSSTNGRWWGNCRETSVRIFFHQKKEKRFKQIFYNVRHLQ